MTWGHLSPTWKPCALSNRDERFKRGHFASPFEVRHNPSVQYTIHVDDGQSMGTVADSVTLATSQSLKAILWTQDTDFGSIKGVQYIARS